MYICTSWSYLAESTSGKLLHVRRHIGCLSTRPEKVRTENSCTLSFEVFEVDLTTNSRHKWTRVNTLGDQALFVGIHSKSLPASRCGAQEDCIYFVSDYGHKDLAMDPLRDCGVFNMRNGIITPLLPDTMVVRPQVCRGRPTWFFPYWSYVLICISSLQTTVIIYVISSLEWNELSTQISRASDATFEPRPCLSLFWRSVMPSNP
jgi:hypothetical protein